MIVLIDLRQSIGEEAAEKLNQEFGRKRAVFLHCDVTNNTEYDGKYIFIKIKLCFFYTLLFYISLTFSYVSI